MKSCFYIGHREASADTGAKETPPQTGALILFKFDYVIGRTLQNLAKLLQCIHCDRLVAAQIQNCI